MKRLCRTEAGSALIYPASGTGAWEAALVNTLSPGDKVLMLESGHFAGLWSRLSSRLGLDPLLMEADWRRGPDPNAVEHALRDDPDHRIKAVCVVQNETSTGCAVSIPAIRAAIDSAGHPALLLVDTISSLGSIDMRMDEWRVDVVVACSQKGLMLPPGLSFNIVSPRALAAHASARLPRSYWDWSEMLGPNMNGLFPYTPATNLLYGLAEAIDMLEEETLDAVLARHRRHGEATRRAVAAWGLEVYCAAPDRYSDSLTAVLMPEGHSADALRSTILDTFNMSLGTGLSKLADKVFRIGHLGDFNDLMLVATLGGVEMGMRMGGVPHRAGGVQEALEHLATTAPPQLAAKAAA